MACRGNVSLDIKIGWWGAHAGSIRQYASQENLVQAGAGMGCSKVWLCTTTGTKRIIDRQIESISGYRKASNNLEGALNN